MLWICHFSTGPLNLERMISQTKTKLKITTEIVKQTHNQTSFFAIRIPNRESHRKSLGRLKNRAHTTRRRTLDDLEVLCYGEW